MNNQEIAVIFSEIADLLERKKENRFKIMAYRNFIRALEELPDDVEQLVRENRLREIPGVGEAINKKVSELVTTGKLEYYQKLKMELAEQKIGEH